MEYLIGFAAGFITLVNPCVLPVLPIVLVSALGAGRAGPLALMAGMSLSFVGLGVAISALGRLAGIDGHTVGQIGAWVMVGFGLVLLAPPLARVFARVTSGVSRSADAALQDVERTSLGGQFLGGLLLGAVWSPCVGPTLGAAIALAARGQDLLRATGIMVAFSLGISAVMLLLAYGARSALMRRRALMQRLSRHARPVMGGAFVAIGLMLAFGMQQPIEAWLLDNLPPWLVDFTVSF